MNETNWAQCFHGPSECTGHTAMLCARNVSTKTDPADYRWFDMVTCMDGPHGLAGVTYGTKRSIPEDAEACAEKAGVEWAAVAGCMNGTQGPQLLHDAHFETMRLFAQHGGYTPAGHGYRPPLIPVLWINGEEYNNPLSPAHSPYVDLRKRVCAAYTGTPPQACTAA